MFGLTTLGAAHTLISLVALASGLWLLARDGQIASRNSLGRVYLAATALTALTALGIFRHGHAGAPHALAVMTLLAVAVGLGAERLGWFGRWSRHAQVLCYTTTLLFHLIPGFTESLTRLPLGQPLLPGPDAPAFKAIYGVLVLLLVVTLALQLRRLSRDARRSSS